ncbi:MAG: FliG C-terminal domain-containing protein [Pseudomonadota bacterium]
MSLDDFDTLGLPALSDAGDGSSDDFGGALALMEETGAADGLSAPQKAAIVIAALGPDAAGPVIQLITDNHLRAFTRAFAKIDRIPRDTLNAVVHEFLGKLNASADELKGGFEQARAILSEYKRNDEIVRLMEDIGAPSGRSVWDRLEESSDKDLCTYFSNQHPQTVAVVLSKLSPDKASMLLALMPEDLAQQALLRMSKPLEIGAAALDALAETIEREFLAPSKTAKSERKPGQMIGAMLNNLPSERRDLLMEQLGEHVPEIVPEVQRFMLTFQDFPVRVPANAAASIVRDLEESVFITALKFGKQNAPKAVDFIMENISQRMAQQYQEQLDKAGKVTVKDGEAAQRQVMAVVRKLENSGEIKLNDVIVETDD